MDNDTRILLNLTDPHLSFSRHWLKFTVVKSVRVAQISCRLSYTPKACPNCGVINRGQIVKFGYYQAKYKYGQFRAQPLMLRVKTQRFRCPDCQSTFNATSDLRITTRSPPHCVAKLYYSFVEYAPLKTSLMIYSLVKRLSSGSLGTSRTSFSQIGTIYHKLFVLMNLNRCAVLKER